MAAGRYENEMSWQQLHATLLDMQDGSRQMRGFVEGQVYQAHLTVVLNHREGLLEEDNLGLIYVHWNRCFFTGEGRRPSMYDFVGKTFNVVVQKSRFNTERFKLNGHLGFHTLISFKAKLAYFDQQRPPTKPPKHYNLGKWTRGKGRLPQYFVELVADENLNKEQVKMADEEGKHLSKEKEEEKQQAPLAVVSNLTNEDFECLDSIEKKDKADDNDYNDDTDLFTFADLNFGFLSL